MSFWPRLLLVACFSLSIFSFASTVSACLLKIREKSEAAGYAMQIVKEKNYFLLREMNPVDLALEKANPGEFMPFQFIFETQKKNGYLESFVSLKRADGTRTPSMGFFEVYQLMLKHFGKEKIKGIRSEWSFGDILDHYIKNREKGLSKEEAAFRTPEGYMAKGNDFPVAEVEEQVNAKGEILRVFVKFKRQKK